MKAKNNVDIAMKLKELEQEAITEVQRPLNRKFRPKHSIWDIITTFRVIKNVKIFDLRYTTFSSVSEFNVPPECLTDILVDKELDPYEITEYWIDLEKQVTCYSNIHPYITAYYTELKDRGLD